MHCLIKFDDCNFVLYQDALFPRPAFPPPPPLHHHLGDRVESKQVKHLLFPLPAEQTNNSWRKIGFHVYMSHLFFQELDGLLPVSSSVGNSSASIDFCRRTIFVIKMADLSKHVLKRKYYCKFSSRASRNVLLIFTCPFRSTKRACELVLPESFKCLTLICWVGTFQRLIHTTLEYHSHFTPLKFWF